mgnify:CR=1 FL=1
MQVKLKEESIVVEQKKADTDVLLVQVGHESAIADEQAELGAIEAEKVAVIASEVNAFAAQCQADLAASARPPPVGPLTARCGTPRRPYAPK